MLKKVILDKQQEDLMVVVLVAEILLPNNRAIHYTKEGIKENSFFLLLCDKDSDTKISIDQVLLTSGM